jgi:hypothetical protein
MNALMTGVPYQKIQKKPPGTTPGAINQTPQPNPHPACAGWDYQSLNQLYNKGCVLKVLKNKICFIFQVNKYYSVFVNLSAQYLFRELV